MSNGLKKVLLLSSISFNIIFVLFFLGKRFYYSHWQLFHHAITIDERWANLFNSKHHNDEIIFLGTSITEGLNVKKEFNNPSVRNMGFAGSISENGIQVINKLIYRKPKKLFLEFGVNDFKYGISIDTVKSNLIKMISIIKDKSPATKIYVESVLPTNLDSLNYKIISYNKAAEEICSLNDIQFVNLYPNFLSGDKIDSDLTFDGTHLTDAGYYNWKRLIIGLVN